VQHRGSTHRLLQLNLVRCTINVVDYQAATSEKLVGSCGAAATETNSCGTPLRSLHWLPVEHRVTYKLAVLTFNVRLTATPAYLNSLISNRVTASRMSLRSSTDRSLMAVPRTKTVCASASRSFSACVPGVWNSLPPDIQLCSCLKT